MREIGQEPAERVDLHNLVEGRNMSSVGRMQNSLYDQWWGYEDGSGNFTEGSLHDLGFERISALVGETIDLFLRCGWHE